jgi:hypothetical protein
MKYRSTSKSTVFLIEMTIVILVFAFCSAISLGLFASAHKIDQRSSNTGIAIMKIQSIAETLKNAPSLQVFKTLANGDDPGSASDIALPGFFDSDWRDVSSAEGAAFAISAAVRTEATDSGTMAYVDLSASKLSSSAANEDSEPLFELTIQKYFIQ